MLKAGEILSPGKNTAIQYQMASPEAHTHALTSNAHTGDQPQMRWMEVGCYEVQNVQAYHKGKTMETQLRRDLIKRMERVIPRTRGKGWLPSLGYMIPWKRHARLWCERGGRAMLGCWWLRGDVFLNSSVCLEMWLLTTSWGNSMKSCRARSGKRAVFEMWRLGKKCIGKRKLKELK